MFCSECGKELPRASSHCPNCGARAIPSTAARPAPVSLDQAISDAKGAAKELASLTAEISRNLAGKAQRAAKDPGGSARRGAHRVAEELHKAGAEIERILKDL
ncbi:MAG: zinc ribbon domain-containing protein [Thermoplasmata archaeon]